MLDRDIGNEILRALGSLKVQGAQHKIEIRSLRDLVERHEKRDDERFLLIREDMARIERTLHPRVEKLESRAHDLTKNDAEITARVSAISEEEAERKTMSRAAKARKHQWVYGIIIAVLGTCLGIFAKWVVF